MAGCMTWTTAAPQSTMIHSPLSSPSVRGAGAPADFTASRTLAASDLVCRLLVPDATMTRSKSGDRCSVLKTTMFWALTSSRPSTMTRCSLRMSIQLLKKIRKESAIQPTALNIDRDRRRHEIGNRLARGDAAANLGRRDVHHRQVDHVMRHLRFLDVDRRLGVGTVGDGEGHHAEELAPVAPGVQARVLVLAEDQHPLGSRLGGDELAHRVQRVADAAPAQLAAVDDEARLASDRQPHHRLAVGAVAHLAALLPRLADRDPAHLVELELLEGEPGQRDMGVVDRVEAAADHANALHGEPVATGGEARSSH